MNLEGLKKTIINVLLITHNYFHPKQDIYLLSASFQLKLSSQINIAMKKVLDRQLTAQIWPNNFIETLRSFLLKDNAYQFTAIV